MLKRFISIAAICAMPLVMSSCSGQQAEDVIKKAQEVAVQVCSFLPTLTTITNILNLRNPLLQTGTEIGNAVCNAVGPKAAPRSVPGGPKVGGVIVEGQRV